MSVLGIKTKNCFQNAVQATEFQSFFSDNKPRNSRLITLLLYLADWLYYFSLTRVGIFMSHIEIFLESLNELLISENGWAQYKISNPFFHQWDVWIQN